MATRDPAFQWETEVLRSARRPPRNEGGAAGRLIDDAGDWLTIREASEVTGVPPSTIRKWARHDNIPSVLEETSDGFLRIVSMRGIERWANEIGRDLARPEPDGEGEGEVDLTAEEPEPSVQEPRVAPEGSMIVPLDAWNRMLNQLGNLHEAGQQLAEARERAAKAETEARFLKERLAELRARLEDTRASASPKTPAQEETPGTGRPISIVKKAYDGWRSRRRERS